MSSGCGDVVSLESMQIARKHQIFEIEVITGKSGGVAGGADIDYATNAVTGQTQKTLPAVLRDAGFFPVSWDFSTGGTLTVNDRDKVVYDPVSKTWYSYAGTLPVTVPASFNPVGSADWKPRTDPDLRGDFDSFVSDLADVDGISLVGGALYSDIRGYSGSASEIYCRGVSDYNDGGGGVFYKDSADTTSADNGGTILVDSLGRRWKRRYSGDVDIRWFGCKTDGVTDNFEPLNRAIQWACASGNKVTFYVPKGVTYVSDTISTPGRYLFNMRGEGGLRDESGSIIKFATNKSLNLRGTSSDGTVTATYMQAFFEGVVFSGTDQALDSPVKLIDTVGVLFDKCTFTMCLYGLNLLNEFRWTETCVARNCYFTTKCTCAILYRVSSGNTYVSFYGSGLENCFLENSGNGSPKIQIAANAQPYNAPLNVTMGHTPDSTHPIIQHSGNVNSWFVGDIKVEVGEEYDCPLVGGSPLYIVGGLTSMGGRVTTQNAYFCYEVRQSVTGNAINFRRKPFSRKTTFTASGGGLVWSYTPTKTPQTFKIYMTVATSGYAYEYELTMHTHYLNGTNGSVTVDKTFRAYDTISVGAPSVEYNAGSTQAQLYVWRSGLPSGAVVFMDIVPVYSGFEYPML